MGNKKQHNLDGTVEFSALKSWVWCFGAIQKEKDLSFLYNKELQGTWMNEYPSVFVKTCLTSKQNVKRDCLF